MTDDAPTPVVAVPHTKEAYEFKYTFLVFCLFVCISGLITLDLFIMLGRYCGYTEYYVIHHAFLKKDLTDRRVFQR